MERELREKVLQETRERRAQEHSEARERKPEVRESKARSKEREKEEREAQRNGRAKGSKGGAKSGSRRKRRQVAARGSTYAFSRPVGEEKTNMWPNRKATCCVVPQADHPSSRSPFGPLLLLPPNQRLPPY